MQPHSDSQMIDFIWAQLDAQYGGWVSEPLFQFAHDLGTDVDIEFTRDATGTIRHYVEGVLVATIAEAGDPIGPGIGMLGLANVASAGTFTVQSLSISAPAFVTDDFTNTDATELDVHHPAWALSVTFLSCLFGS